MTEDEALIGATDLEPMKSAKIAPAHGIAALALNFALKYHDINTVQDGTLYQQYKLEGRNMHDLHLDMVFETAMQIEAHLLRSSERIANLVVDAIAVGIEEEEAQATSELEGKQP
jgi:RNase adaptor protein for sRNA GlmZ degradation